MFLELALITSFLILILFLCSPLRHWLYGHSLDPHCIAQCHMWLKAKLTLAMTGLNPLILFKQIFHFKVGFKRQWVWETLLCSFTHKNLICIPLVPTTKYHYQSDTLKKWHRCCCGQTFTDGVSVCHCCMCTCVCVRARVCVCVLYLIIMTFSVSGQDLWSKKQERY